MGEGLRRLLPKAARIRKIMKLYLSVIGVAMALIAAFNIIFGVSSWYYAVIAVIWCTALQFALDGFIAIVINKMPDKWFGVTYQEDRPVVVENIKKLTEAGVYPAEGLWK